MEALSLCYSTTGGSACSRYVTSSFPKPMIAVYSCLSPAPTIARVAEAIRSGRESVCTVVPLPPGEDSLPRPKKDRSISNASFETRTSAASAGGRSDPGAEAAAAPPPPLPAVKSIDLGVLRTSWIEKHQTSVYGTIVVVEDLDLSPSKDRLTIETNIVNRVDRVRQSCRGRSTRVVLVLLTQQAPGEVPKYGMYQTWDELNSQIRNKCGISDSKLCLVAHDSCQADWLRSVDRLSRMAYDNAIAYHRDEAVRIKRKLKADKVVRSPASKALAVRIRFKVGWHFEAGRELRLADHNYVRGYEDLLRLPATLEVIMAADVFMYRMMNLSAASMGGQKAAKLLEAHVLWSEKLDLSLGHLTVVDAEHPHATRFVPKSVLTATRLLHLLHMAESQRRFSSLMLKIQPFTAEDPSAPADASKKLTEAGQWSGTHAGVPQLCHGTALAYRRLRQIMTILASALGVSSTPTSSAITTAVPFVGRPPQKAEEAMEFVRLALSNITTQEISAHIFTSVSIAMPVCQDAGMTRLCSQLSYLIAEHYDFDKKPEQALSHTAAALKQDRASVWRSIASAASSVKRSALKQLQTEDSPEIEFRQQLIVSASFSGSIFGNAHGEVDEERKSRVDEVKLNVLLSAKSGECVLSASRIEIHIAFTATPSVATATSCTEVTVENVTLSQHKPLAARFTLGNDFARRSGWYFVSHVVATLQNGCIVSIPTRTTPFAARLMQLALKDAAFPNVPRLSRRVLPEPAEVSCVRVWNAPQVASFAIIAAPHAIEAERHVWVIKITATRGNVQNGLLRFAVPSLAFAEPVVGLAGDVWGPWTLQTDSGLVAECPIKPLEVGRTVWIPCVVLCHKAGQASLPMRFHYQNNSTPFTVNGTFALHVMHPVFAHFELHGAMRVKTQDVSRPGQATKALLLSDFAVARFTESTEQDSDKVIIMDPTHLRHSFAGVDRNAPFRCNDPTEYRVAQNAVADGRCVPLKVPERKPFALSMQLVNSLLCVIDIVELKLERHAHSGVVVVGAPNFDRCTLNVDEQCCWSAVFVGQQLGGASLGTLVVSLRRKISNYLDFGRDRVPVEIQMLVESLGGSEILFELPLPLAFFSAAALESTVDFPPVVEVGKPFNVTITLKNHLDVRPISVDLTVEDAASSSIAVAGRTKCSVSLPGRSTRTITWIAVARCPGHVAFPAISADAAGINSSGFENFSTRNEVAIYAHAPLHI